MPVETTAEVYKARQTLLRRSLLRNRVKQIRRSQENKASVRKANEYRPILPEQQKIQEAGVPAGAREAEAAGLPVDWQKVPWLQRRKERLFHQAESRLQRRSSVRTGREKSGVFREKFSRQQERAHRMRRAINLQRREQVVERLKGRIRGGNPQAFKPMGWTRPAPTIPVNWLKPMRG